MTIPPHNHHIRALQRCMHAADVLTTDAAKAPFLQEQRGLFTSNALAIVCPRNTAEVAAVVRYCASAHIAVVPQGGNTGLCGGAVCAHHPDHPAIILSTRHLDRIRNIDPENFTATAEAGVILQTLQDAASQHHRLFPLSLAAEGSCTIGGTIATNAGGINVLRYGTMRDLVLGLEVVLPSGEIWHGLRRLGKDNTGYALKHMFIGAEGTLGIITAATLKLYPRPVHQETAFCALPSTAAAGALLALVREVSGDCVTAFELMPHFAVDIACKHGTDLRHPFQDASQHSPWFALIEFSSPAADMPLRKCFERGLARAMEQGLITDAVVAETQQHQKQLWLVRESIPAAQRCEGGSIKHDVSVPISRIPEFIEAGIALVTKLIPGVRPCPFGHYGDGNIHFNFSQPVDMDKQDFLAQWDMINTHMHALVRDFDGSISAEHGIGRLKTTALTHHKAPVELMLMQQIKHAIDPHGLMNPDVIFAQQPADETP
jgi:D-lactate dehydrogenase (cytochrome)